MRDFVSLLEAHDKLAGWAQFFGAMVALVATYFTAFLPIWHRKKQLRKSAERLLSNGYEVLESYNRTTPKFRPVRLTLRGAALNFGNVIDEIGRFPIYELDDQDSRSTSRHLVALTSNLAAVKLVIESLAEDIGNREATKQEHDDLIEFLGNQLELVRKMLTGEKLVRPEWPPE